MKKEYLQSVIQNELRFFPNKTIQNNSKDVYNIGEDVFKLETEQGFPSEMYLEELKSLGYTSEELAKIYTAYSSKLLSHRIVKGSPMSEEAKKKLRDRVEKNYFAILKGKVTE